VQDRLRVARGVALQRARQQQRDEILVVGVAGEQRLNVDVQLARGRAHRARRLALGRRDDLLPATSRTSNGQSG
jgi:hypothetical protein